MNNFPKQRLSYSEKIKDNYKWGRDTLDAILLDAGAVPREWKRMKENYELYNNIVDQKALERECNPYGLDVGQFTDEVQPYNKIPNKINALVGEEALRNLKYNTLLINPDAIISKLAHKDAMYRNFVYSKINAVLEELGFSLPEELFDPEQVIDPAEMDSYMSTKYRSGLEIAGSVLIDILMKRLNIRDIKADSLKHVLISGLEYTYVGKQHDNPIVNPLNSLGAFYYKDDDEKWIQNGLYAGYRSYRTAGYILDRYNLSKEDADKIATRDAYSHGQNYNGADYVKPVMDYHHDDYFYNQFQTDLYGGSYGSEMSTSGSWLVQHVEWRSQTKVGFLSKVNEYGDVEEDIVSEDFEIPSYAKTQSFPNSRKPSYKYWTEPSTGTPYKLEWGWIPEIWEGTRIGHDIYTEIGPKEYQFRDIDNPYSVKLGYHGYSSSSMNAAPISLLDRMKPFQYLYFIVMHKLRKLIAQDKGRIFHFDISMVDPKVGLEKTLYYLTSLNIDFFNPLQNADQPGWSQRGKVTSSTDLTVSDQIINYINILAYLDQEIADVGGVSKQREGQIAPTEAVTNAQQNIQTSAVVTQVYTQPHNKHWEHVMNSLVDVAAACYKNKTVAEQVILDDMTVAILELTPDSLTNASFGVYVTNSPKEEEMFRQIQNLAQPLIQNDKAKMSDIISLLQARSLEDLKRNIIKTEKVSQEREDAMIQQQMQAQQQMQQAEHDFEFEKQARDIEAKIKVAEINSFKMVEDQDINNNNVPDQLEIERVRLEKKKVDIEKEKAKNQSSK